MKKMIIAAALLASTTVMANEFQDEMKDVKTPTPLTTLLGQIDFGHREQVAACGQSNEAYNSLNCVEKVGSLARKIQELAALLGLKHDGKSVDPGSIGGN